MNLIFLLQSFVLLLSLSTAAARDKDGNLREEDTRPLILGQPLIDGKTEVQVGKESSIRLLVANPTDASTSLAPFAPTNDPTTSGVGSN